MQDFILLGDIAFTGLLSEEPSKNHERFKEVAPLLQKSDIVFANLEVPVKVSETVNEHKKFIHYSLPEPTEQLLKLLNIGCVSLANNHIYDCKMDGLKATINLLDKIGICHTGAGWKQEHIKPAVIEKNDSKIGFIAYVDRTTNPKSEFFPELLINYYDREKVISDVIELKKKVDRVICSIHWGVDYSFYPTQRQIEDARILVDAGVDIIMGHHPHTLQPYEKNNNGYIFYSLGGLTFGDYIKEGKTDLQALFRKTKNGVIAQYSSSNNSFSFTSTMELKGNTIAISKSDFFKWSNTKWLHFRLKHKSSYATKLFDFKEKVLDRVYEYFWGYYKNPIKRLFQISNLGKISRLFKDYKTTNNEE